MSGVLARGRRSKLAGPLALVAVGLIAFSVLVITGGTAHGDTPVVSTSPADITAGRNLFIAHCQSCHGVNGIGGVNGSPELIDAGAAAADFYLSTGRMPLNNPAQSPIRHRPFFNNQQIAQLVAYVNALPAINGVSRSGPGIPNIQPLCPTTTPEPGCVTLSQGQAAYALDCAACHQAATAGNMLSKGTLIPSLRNASALQVAEAARVGPKPMPVFGVNQLSEAQVSAIAHYVEYLHKSGNPGGLPISHFGPVAEGFVGILLGLGVLLVLTRLMGARS